MILGSATEINSGAFKSPETKVKSMGKNDFMKLLVAQLQNQDPLEPMKGTDFSAQLAQFSTVEQIFNMNETLLSIKDGNSQLNGSLAMNMIGKQVEAKGNSIHLSNGGSSTVTFDLPEMASEAKVTIYNASGDLVARINKEDLQAGRQEIVWKGTDVNGIKLPDGEYTFQVSASNIDGEELEATPYTLGTIDGIVYDKDKIYATIEGKKVLVDNISTIKQSK